MAGERFEVEVDGGVRIAAERWPGDGPPVVLLHAGVADRRAWADVAPRLSGPVVAYDRRGCGETPPFSGPFTHLADLRAVLDATVAGPAWLVGNSMGGAVALEGALAARDRVAGLVLIAPAVPGQPWPEGMELDEPTARIVGPLEAAVGAGDVEEQLRLHAWLWLDGPAATEGRVGGPARELAVAMNERIIRNAMPDEAGEAGIDVWSRLEEIAVPTTVVWGELDEPYGIDTCRSLVERIPGARAAPMEGVAHLPSLERPAELAELIQASTSGR